MLPKVWLGLVADGCNLGTLVGAGGRTPAEVAHKLAVLRRHCAAVGRPYEAVLRSHFTHWLLLAEDEAGVAAKGRRYRLDGTAGTPCGVVATTPAGAVAYFQALADVGIQYFIVQVLDAADEETVQLLGRTVAPHVRPRPRAAA